MSLLRSFLVLPSTCWMSSWNLSMGVVATLTLHATGLCAILGLPSLSVLWYLSVSVICPGGNSFVGSPLRSVWLGRG